MENFIDEGALSVALNISVSALRKWRLEGTGPKYYKPGGRSVRYRISDVEVWMAQWAVSA